MKTFTMGKQIKRRGVTVAFCAILLSLLAALCCISMSAKAEETNEIAGHANDSYSFSLPLYDSRLLELDPDADDYSEYGEEFEDWTYSDFAELYSVGLLEFTATKIAYQVTSMGQPITLYKLSDFVADLSEYASRGYRNFQFRLDYAVFPFGLDNSCFSISGNTALIRSMSTNTTLSFEEYCQEMESAGFEIFGDYVRTEVSLPEEPEKEGYTFSGWYYGTQEEHGAKCTAYNGEPIYENTNLHAHWKINTYTVSFNSAGGTTQDSVTVNWNTAVTLPTPVRIGYNFLGWYLSDGTEYTNQPIKNDTALTAKWEIQTFTVTFHVDGEEYKSVTVEYGTTLLKAMQKAKVASFGALSMDGANISKTSVITENESVLIYDLTKAEKVGAFLGTHSWLLWFMLAFGCALAITATVAIIVAVKRR